MKAIVTGSFDPITSGHVHIIKRISSSYEAIYVVALVNENKEYMFTMDEKKAIIKESLFDIPNVIVDTYTGLTADYMHKHGINKIIRGIRNDQDEKYELELAKKMQDFDPCFETIILRCDDEYKHISSSLVKEKIKKGESICGLVEPNAELKIIQILSKK